MRSVGIADLVDVMSVRRARAGLLAEGKYRRGLKAYRRRMRTPLLVVVLPMFVLFWGVALTRKLDPWSLAAGAFLSAVAISVSARAGSSTGGSRPCKGCGRVYEEHLAP